MGMIILEELLRKVILAAVIYIRKNRRSKTVFWVHDGGGGDRLTHLRKSLLDSVGEGLCELAHLAYPVHVCLTAVAHGVLQLQQCGEGGAHLVSEWVGG